MRLIPAVLFLLFGLVIAPSDALAADAKTSASWKAMNDQAQVLVRQGNVERAIEVAQQSLTFAKTEFGANSPEAAESMGNLATLYRLHSVQLAETATQLRQQQRSSAGAPSTPQKPAQQKEVPSVPAAAKSGGKLVFGLIAGRGAELITKNWQPFVDAMSARLGIPIEMVVKPDFKDIVDLFKQGKLDICWIGNIGALEIVESGKGALFAKMATKLGGTGYKALLITHKASKIQSLKDVLVPNNGYVFGDGDVKSTSGHLVPLYCAFVQNKVNDPSTLFKEIKRSNHRTNLMLTAKREVDIATSNNEELQFFINDHPDLAANIRVVWTSPEIPHSPLVWRRALSPALKRQISDFVVNYGKNSDAERKVLMDVNGLTGFSKTSNRQLITIAELEMFSEHRKLWNNRELSPDDRKTKERELSKRASRLDVYLRAGEDY